MPDPKTAAQRQFGRQAAAYARSATHAHDVDLPILIEHLPLQPDDHILDVATGTGFTAFALSAQAGRVIGLDLTWEMLVEAQRLRDSIANIDWIQGDVEGLPFGDGTFSIVTCRRSAHHFPHLDRALDEMLRVLRPRGVLGIVDHVGPDGSAGGDLMHTLERMRDPSHVHAPSARAWRCLLEAHGVTVEFADLFSQRVFVFEEWLARAGVDPPRGEQISALLAGASPAAQAEIGYQGRPAPSFMRSWLVLIGRR